MSTTHAGATGPGAPDTSGTAFSSGAVSSSASSSNAFSSGAFSGAAPRKRYALAAAIAVVGLTASSLWAVSGVLEQTRRPAAFDRADLPGSVTLTVDEAARVVVYVEADRRARPDGGGAAQIMTVEQLTVAGPAGDDVRVDDYPADLRYDVPATALPDDGAPARVGPAVAAVEAEVTGTYTVTAAGTVHLVGDDEVRQVEGATLAVGADLAPGAARAILFPAITGVGSVLLAAGLALRTAFRQARGSRS